MKVIDPGHVFHLQQLDGDGIEVLTFVKRNDPPEKFPGNTSAHAGTISQDVIRALISRTRYVDQQQHWDENDRVIHHLQMAMYYLEVRAHRARGMTLRADPAHIDWYDACQICGHIFCEASH